MVLNSEWLEWAVNGLERFGWETRKLHPLSEVTKGETKALTPPLSGDTFPAMEGKSHNCKAIVFFGGNVLLCLWCKA